jgi:hypothetical protein
MKLMGDPAFTGFHLRGMLRTSCHWQTLDSVMKAKYIAVWKLHGANKLTADASSLELARLSDPTLVASVTTNPECHLLHIDRSAAIGTQLLKGLFSPDKEATPEQRLAAELERVKANRTKRLKDGVFLILEGERDVAAPDFKFRRDTGEFTVCFDAIDKSAISASFHPLVQAIITALDLSLPANVDHQVERVGELVYLVDPESGNPIYTFSSRVVRRGSHFPVR